MEPSINFMNPPLQSYRKLIDYFYTPITQVLRVPYTLSDEARPDALNVSMYVEKPGDVFLPHGLADKNYRTPEDLKPFKYLLYSGPAWKEKAVEGGFPQERVFIVGYPKFDVLRLTPRSKVFSARPQKVVWAPTHDAIRQVSSYLSFLNDFYRLKQDLPEVELSKSLHPACPKGEVTDPLTADVILSDSSSVIYEALFFEIPVVLLGYLVEDGVRDFFKGTFEEKLYSEKLCAVAQSYEHLVELLKGQLFDLWSSCVQGFSFAKRIVEPYTVGFSGPICARVLEHLLRKEFGRSWQWV